MIFCLVYFLFFSVFTHIYYIKRDYVIHKRRKGYNYYIYILIKLKTKLNGRTCNHQKRKIMKGKKKNINNSRNHQIKIRKEKKSLVSNRKTITTTNKITNNSIIQDISINSNNHQRNILIVIEKIIIKIK